MSCFAAITKSKPRLWDVAFFESALALKLDFLSRLLGNFKIDRFQQIAGGIQDIHPPRADLMCLNGL